MAVYSDVFEDINWLFFDLISTLDNLNSLRIKVLAIDKLKDVTKVQKSNDLLRHETGNDIYIFVNEGIFEKLTEEQRKMVVEETVAEIYYDDEKDKVTIIKPDFTTFSLFLQKYGGEKCINLKRLIKELVESDGEDNENGGIDVIID
jgi:hypothetical protein